MIMEIRQTMEELLEEQFKQLKCEIIRESKIHINVINGVKTIIASHK